MLDAHGEDIFIKYHIFNVIVQHLSDCNASSHFVIISKGHRVKGSKVRPSVNSACTL